MSAQTFDVQSVRRDFPILQEEVNGHPLVYLDNAATTQKPESVIRAISDYYRHYNSNVHRGAHALSDKATQAFEAARLKVSSFINSPQPENIIWTKGTTESINLVAHSWGRVHLQEDDIILVSYMEHHSNIVPWQLVAQEKGAKVIAIPVDEFGNIDLEALSHLLNQKVKLIAVNQVSNALGTINPIDEIVALARDAGALVLVDGAQAVAHFPVDVQALDCDFYVFSGHKIFGPTGTGVLWGKQNLLENMSPYQGGGEMIEQVSFSGTTYNKLPYKFEAGTPDIAGAIGLGAAIDYVSALDRAAASEHENDLLTYAIGKGEDFSGLTRIGRAKKTAGVFSFILEGVHPLDVGMLLDQQGIAVRTGHHCAQPIMENFGIPGTIRASFSIYNTMDEVDALFRGLEKAAMFLK